MKRIQFAGALAVLVAVSGCMDKAEGDKATVYTVNTTVDPITDRETVSAAAHFKSEDGLNESEIAWTCIIHLHCADRRAGSSSAQHLPSKACAGSSKD